MIIAKLQTKADSLPSLCYLRTGFMSLTWCYPLFLSCGSSPWEVEKAVTQSRLLSGRYRLEALATGHLATGMVSVLSLSAGPQLPSIRELLRPSS